jgi:hypothetical protein
MRYPSSTLCELGERDRVKSGAGCTVRLCDTVLTLDADLAGEAGKHRHKDL